MYGVIISVTMSLYRLEPLLGGYGSVTIVKLFIVHTMGPAISGVCTMLIVLMIVLVLAHHLECPLSFMVFAKGSS